MPDSIYLPPETTGNAVKVNGVCFERVGSSSVSPTAPSSSEQFESCDACNGCGDCYLCGDCCFSDQSYLQYSFRYSFYRYTDEYCSGECNLGAAGYRIRNLILYFYSPCVWRSSSKVASEVESVGCEVWEPGPTEEYYWIRYNSGQWEFNVSQSANDQPGIWNQVAGSSSCYGYHYSDVTGCFYIFPDYGSTIHVLDMTVHNNSCSQDAEGNCTVGMAPDGNEAEVEP